MPKFSYKVGVYSVPDGMPRDVAEMALRKGIGTKVMPVFELKRRKK